MWRTKGMLLEGRRDLEAAALAYEGGLRRAPDDGELLYRLGRLRLELGRPDEARDLLERARAAAPDDRRIDFVLERLRRAEPAAAVPGDAPLPPSARADLR